LKLSDIVQKEGIEKSEQKPKASASSAPRRRHFWDQEENENMAIEDTQKPAPIMSQSGANHEPLHAPIMSQSGANHEPKIDTNITLLSNHTPQPEPLHAPIMSQSGANHEPSIEFYSLVGLQRNSLLFIFETCLKNGSKTSSPISSSILAISLKSTVAAVRKATRRLEEKGFLIRSQFKDGRGGWTRYELPKTVYSDLLTLRTSANHEPIMSQSGAKPTPQPTPQPEPSLPSSSRGVFLNNSTTTQNVDNFDSDADALKNFDFSIVREFGITSSTLSRCRELYPTVSTDQLTALTERFGKFMKTTGGKRVQNARGFFISLAEQLSRGIVPLDHIETQDEALMREFVEQAKEAKARRELLEKEAFEFAFEEWVEKLDSKKRDELVPPNSVIESGSKIQTMQLKEYFRQNVWPTRFTPPIQKPAEI
jgi:hypothetical protein